jgi:hypothetical protein
MVALKASANRMAGGSSKLKARFLVVQLAATKVVIPATVVTKDETVDPPITRCTANYTHVGANNTIGFAYVIGDCGIYTLPSGGTDVQAVIDASGVHPDFMDTCLATAALLVPRAVVAGDVVPITFDIQHDAA